MPAAKKTEKEKVREEFKVKGKELVGKVKEAVKEGNVRRIIVKLNDGQKLLEIPVTIGIIGAVLAPYLVVLGGIAAVITSCSIVVEKN